MPLLSHPDVVVASVGCLVDDDEIVPHDLNVDDDEVLGKVFKTVQAIQRAYLSQLCSL